MHFRKQLSFFLAILILLANLGLRFSVHYCKDEIAAVSFEYDVQEPCVQEINSCCAKLVSHDSCCSNKIIKVEKKTDDILVKTFNLVLQSIDFYNQSVSSFIGFESGIITPNQVGFYCNCNAPPLYKLNCQYIFYA